MWYFFDQKARQDIHEEWNDTLDKKGLDNNKKAEECDRNYDVIDKDDHEKAKTLKEENKSSNKIQYMSDDTFE